jgi:hypothetical protein
VFLASALSAPPVQAQNHFLEGAWVASVERTISTTSTGSMTLSAEGWPQGTVLGAGAALGTWLTPRVSVRLELSLPRRLSVRQERFNPERSVVDPRNGEPLVIPAFTTGLELWTQTRTVSTMVAYHTPRRGRVALAYLGGPVFGFRVTSQSSFGQSPMLAPAGGFVLVNVNSGQRTTSYGVTAGVGMDADVQLTRHVSAVPQIRMFVLSGLSVRPAVALRATW